MSRVAFDEINFNDGGNGTQVEFFMLKDDGDEAIVRFLHDTVESFDIVSCHEVNLDGKTRKVDCVRNPREPLTNCPFCASGMKVTQRFFIHLIEYTKADDGSVVATPKIWERSVAYATKLKNLIQEYGPLSDSMFKIHRTGARGSMQTDYSIMFCNPKVYDENHYPKNESAFGDYSVVGTIIMSKTPNDMREFLTTGMFPVDGNDTNSQHADVTPNYAPAPMQPVAQQYIPTGAPARPAPTTYDNVPPWQAPATGSPRIY